MKKYFIDKDNKKVIVNLSQQDTVYDELYNRSLFNAMYVVRDCTDECDLINEDTNVTYKGIAKCSQSDCFNEKIGLDIAESKAYYKYHKAMTNRYNEKIKYLLDIIHKLEELKEVHSKKCTNIKKYLKKYE